METEIRIMIIYVDIDETICITNSDRDYTSSKPIQKNIDIIKKYNEFDIEIYSYLKKNKLFTEITNSNGKRTKNNYFIYSLDFQVNDKQTIVVDEKKMTNIMQYLISKNFKIIETS